MKTAIKTDYFTGFRDLRSFTTQKRAEENKVDPDIQQLYEMSLTDGWRVLNNHIENIKEDLDNMVKVLIESGATFDEIGQKTMVKELCKEVLNKIQQKVQDAGESITGEE